jgi:ATP-dependent DNA helicase RecG
VSIVNEIQNGENKKLEFKSAMVDNKKFAKTIVAFSNTSGGKFIIGISDDNFIVGVIPYIAP